jgi:hypothetical protein
MLEVVGRLEEQAVAPVLVPRRVPVHGVVVVVWH